MEARDFPITAELDRIDTTVAPPRGSGIIVDMAPKGGHPVLITVLLPDGSLPAPGSSATIDGVSGVEVVGKDGQIFVSDLEQSTKGSIELPTGRCDFLVALPKREAENGMTRVGPLTCTPNRSQP